MDRIPMDNLTHSIFVDLEGIQQIAPEGLARHVRRPVAFAIREAMDAVAFGLAKDLGYLSGYEPDLDEAVVTTADAVRASREPVLAAAVMSDFARELGMATTDIFLAALGEFAEPAPGTSD
jgi:hypothetical protein